MTEINLDTGEIEGDEPPIGQGRPREKGSRRTDKERADDRRKYREKKLAGGTGAKADAEVASRTQRVLNRVADRRENHGDHELADAIREDGPSIAQGVADVTKNVQPLRIPVLLILGVIEPIIAFLRVGGILAGRMNARRGDPAGVPAVDDNGLPVINEMGQALDTHGNPIN